MKIEQGENKGEYTVWTVSGIECWCYNKHLRKGMRSLVRSELRQFKEKFDVSAWGWDHYQNYVGNPYLVEVEMLSFFAKMDYIHPMNEGKRIMVLWGQSYEFVKSEVPQ